MSDIMPFYIYWSVGLMRVKMLIFFGKSIINKGFLIVLCFASIRIKQG